MSDFVSVTYPVARKERYCCECRCSIAPRTRYARLAGATDGHGWSETMCLACEDLNTAVWAIVRADRLNEDDGPRFGELVAWIEEAEVADRLPQACATHYADVRERLKSSA